jgi:hypothetical protein
MHCAQSGDHESNAQRRSDKQSLFISTDDTVGASSVVMHVQGQMTTVHSINKGSQVGRWDWTLGYHSTEEVSLRTS